MLFLAQYVGFALVAQALGDDSGRESAVLFVIFAIVILAAGIVVRRCCGGRTLVCEVVDLKAGGAPPRPDQSNEASGPETHGIDMADDFENLDEAEGNAPGRIEAKKTLTLNLRH